MNKLSRISALGVLGFAFINSGYIEGKDKENKSYSQNQSVQKPLLNTALSTVIKERPFSIALSEGGKKWVEKSKDVYKKTKANQDGGLIDASTFLAPDQEKRLERLIGKKGKVNAVELEFKKLNQIDNGYKYAIDIVYDDAKKERWYLNGAVYNKDQYPNGEPAWSSALSIWRATPDGKVDKLTQNYLQFYKVCDWDSKIDFQYLLDKIKGAKENRQKELEDPARIKIFDLPKNEPIGYIGLADGNDPVFPNNVNDTKYFAEVMSHVGYKMVSNEKDKYSISPETKPQEIIKEQVQAFLKKDIKNIYINLCGHGNNFGVYFTTKNKRSLMLTVDELLDIFNTFQECNFIVSTDACSGGGYANLLKRYEDPTCKKGRITLFVQSKPDATNQEGRLKGTSGVNGAPEIFSTYYYIFLVHHLLSGKTYGEAHLLADQDTKRLIQCDAEVWISGPKGGISTARLDYKRVSLCYNL